MSRQVIYLCITALMLGATSAQGALVHHWRFDENTAAGDMVAMDSVGGLNGTIEGAQSVPGQSGNALSFDGSDDVVTIDNFIPPPQGTIVFWLNPALAKSKERILGAGGDYEVWLRGNGELKNELFDGASATTGTGPGALNANEWNHIATTYDSATTMVEIYLDGELRASGLAGTPSTPTETMLLVGHRSGAADAEHYGGLLDDLRIYDHVLSQAEIRQTMEDVIGGGRLIVPKTSVVPIIDGELDGVWHNVGETRCLITDMINTVSAPPENWYDLFGTFKAMYDADHFYIFVEVQDSVLDYEFSNWNGDGVEIFFDGDNSKGDTYDGVNDNQIRITVDDVNLPDIDSSLPVEGAAFKVLVTDLGYNVEASFPLEALQIYPSEDPDDGIAPNNIVGFEVQINDNDSAGGRETLARWHSNDNDSYRNASLFGEAQLVSRTVGEILDVARVAFAPSIDGVMEVGWEALPEITCNKYVLTESDLSKQDDYTDARFSFRTGWDDENIYLFASVLDDMYYDLTTNHTSDGVELFFDADNSKTFEAYDQVDDVQLRINHADLTSADIDISGGSRAPANVTKDNINFVVMDTAVGYDMEIAIPLADLALPAESGHVFGFDLFLNDADEDVRDNIRNYWSGNNDNWRYAHLFGEAVLTGDEEPSDLVAWWKLDDNPDDSSGNGHNGTIEGSPTWISPGWDGTGACMQFGGDSDRITVESFDVTGTGVTLAAWINVITFQDDARMVSKSQGSGTADHYWAMILSGSGEDNMECRLKTDIGATTRRTAPEGTEVQANEWIHVAVTWDAGDPFMRLYKNGQEIDSVSKSGTAVATANDVKIGVGNQSATVPGDGGIRPFGGLIDDVRVYDRGLSPEEILELAGQ